MKYIIEVNSKRNRGKKSGWISYLSKKGTSLIYTRYLYNQKKYFISNSLQMDSRIINVL